MTALLAIDPGANTGIALFFLAPGCAPSLVEAMVLRVDDPLWTRYQPDLVIIESPERTYAGKRERDILTLARTVGRYQERFKNVRQRLVSPHEWKGSIDGDIMTKRIETAMSPAERKLIDALKAGTRHNAVDAVGLGKWAVRQAWMPQL